MQDSNPGQTRRRSGAGWTAWARPAILSFAALSLAVPASAGATNGQRQKSIGGEAQSAATQPLQDLNLAGDDVPTELLLLQEDPYSTDGLKGCAEIDRQIASLETILGPDVDVPRQKPGMFRAALKTGGSFLGSFIPFRGVIRELSGANARKKRMEDAVYVGVARRSFLKGYAASLGCPTAEERAIKAARQGLGME
jgi:hypothetical protein